MNVNRSKGHVMQRLKMFGMMIAIFERFGESLLVFQNFGTFVAITQKN